MKKTWTGIEVKAAGAVVAALGITVLVGWATETQNLVMIFPPTAMQRNTALGLLVSGLGMIWLTGRRKLPVLLSGAFCVLLGLLTAVEYAFRLNLGIDELLGHRYSVGIVSPPGRMSPITTVCFVLAGLSLFLLRSNQGRRLRHWVPGIAGPVLAAIGAVAGMGYIFGNTNAFGWSHFTRIAFHTALAFLVIGISLVIFAWSEEGESEPATGEAGGRRPLEWLPLSLGIAVLTATVGIWQALMARGLEKQPLLPEIALASGVVLALLLALLVHRMQSGKGSPESTLLAGFGLALATLLAVGIVQHRNIQVLVETEGWVAHTQTVLAELEETVSAVQRMESDVRGYVATGDESFVKKSGIWAALAAEHIRDLRKLTADNPRQQASLDKVEPLIRQKIDFMRRLGLLRRDHGPAEANALIARREGVRLMEEIRVLGEEMKAQENVLLTVRKAESAASARKADMVITLGTLLALTFVLGAGWITRRDSAQRQQAEQHLRESEEKYRTLFDSMDEGFCTIEVLFDENDKPVDYRFLDVNPSFERQTGIQNARGRTMREIAPLHEEHWFEIYGKIALTGEPARFENQAAQLHRWYDVYAFRTGDRRQNRVAILFSDITKRKQSETALRESEEAFRQASAYNRSLIEASVDPMVTISPQGQITDANEAAARVRGLSRQEVVGTDFSDYFTEPEKARAAYQQVFREGRVQNWELAMRPRAGHATPVLYNASVYRDEAGEVVGVFAAARDITERKRAEEEIHRLNESLEERVRERTAELEAANHELQAFTYSVSHDLRAPLRHIDGFSRLLEEEHGKALPDEARHYVDVIRNGTRRMGLMVDDLLSLSRVGRQGLRVQMTGLDALIEEVRQDLQSEIAGRTIDWKIGPLPFLECDPGLMKQVLANLLSNAVKFTRLRQDAVIEVGSTLQGGSPVIFVRDNGVGFSMKYVGKLFGVFQRLHRAEDFEGTGVGLATVQRIVNKHGGWVWAEAELNKGATFYITLGPGGPGSAPARARLSPGPTSVTAEAHSPLRGAS